MERKFRYRPRSVRSRRRRTTMLPILLWRILAARELIPLAPRMGGTAIWARGAAVPWVALRVVPVLLRGLSEATSATRVPEPETHRKALARQQARRPEN